MMKEANISLEKIKKSKSKVTVITPTFNRQDLISEAINSVLGKPLKILHTLLLMMAQRTIRDK